MRKTMFSLRIDQGQGKEKEAEKIRREIKYGRKKVGIRCSCPAVHLDSRDHAEPAGQPAGPVGTVP